jgi:hypothetical protein
VLSQPADASSRCIGAEGHAIDRLRVAGQAADLSAGPDFPELDAVVDAPGGEQFSVGTERDVHGPDAGLGGGDRPADPRATRASSRRCGEALVTSQFLFRRSGAYCAALFKIAFASWSEVAFLWISENVQDWQTSIAPPVAASARFITPPHFGHMAEMMTLHR